MLIHKVPKKVPKEGEHISNNFETDVVFMTKNQATELIIALSSMLRESGNPAHRADNLFRAGLYYEKQVAFVVLPEEKYLENFYELRAEEEKTEDVLEQEIKDE